MSSDLTPSTKSRLVRQAEETLDKVKTDDGFEGQTAQLRNLLQIVQTESEIPVLRNFIRYQTGRKATKKFWLLIYEDVLAILEEIGAEFAEEHARRAALQSFFGYLVRHYVYLSEWLRQHPTGGAAAGGEAGHGGRARTSGGTSPGAPAGAARPPRQARS